MLPDALDVRLNVARLNAGLTIADLWLRYFGLGGTSTPVELEALLFGARMPTDHDHDLIAHALNERFVELGGNHSVPYVNCRRSVQRPS